jgi:hypothetical protein
MNAHVSDGDRVFDTTTLLLVFDVHSQYTSIALGYPAGFPNGDRGYRIPANAEIRST